MSGQGPWEYPPRWAPRASVTRRGTSQYFLCASCFCQLAGGCVQPGRRGGSRPGRGSYRYASPFAALSMWAGASGGGGSPTLAPASPVWPERPEAEAHPSGPSPCRRRKFPPGAFLPSANRSAVVSPAHIPLESIQDPHPTIIRFLVLCRRCIQGLVRPYSGPQAPARRAPVGSARDRQARIGLRRACAIFKRPVACASS